MRQAAPEISYDGGELLYACTDEQVSLFKEDVNVIISDKQSFACFDAAKLDTLNASITTQYGVEVTEVNISLEKM